MPRKLFIFSLILSFSYLSLLSQNDWHSGYILSSETDTIYGFLDFRNSRSSGQVCYFRKSENGKTTTYKPTEIYGYRFTPGKFYISRNIEKGDGENETVFLEFLINGEANVYYYRDVDDRYFLEKEGELIELKNTEHLIERYQKDKSEIGGTFVHEKKEYLGLLTYHFQKAEMEEQIQNTKLEHKSLIRLAKNYHNKVCNTAECIIYEKRTKKVKIKFGPVFGLNHNSINMATYPFVFPDLFYFDTNSEMGYFGGFAINIEDIPMIHERVSFQTQLLISQAKVKGEDGRILNIPLLLDYQLMTSKFHPRIEAGFTTYLFKKIEQLTWLVGLSLNYEFESGQRAFVSLKRELNLKFFRLGAGVLF